MPRMRKVVLTIELKTCLTVRELRKPHSIIFGVGDPEDRTTVRQVMPEGINHDCRGTIEQVQVNVVTK